MQRALVDRARGGDRYAFALLASGAVDRMYATARLILRDTDLAEDATQEALVRAWRDLPNLRDPDAFDAWIRRLLVRSCADIGRRQRRWRTEITFLPTEPVQPDGASDRADRDQLERGLCRLNDRQRTMLVLHFYVGLTPTEVAHARDSRRDGQVTIDGHGGKQFEVTAPLDALCDLKTWANAARTNGVGAGEINVLRVLDLDGTRLMIAGAFGPSEGNRARVEQVMDSVQIGQ